MKQVTIAAAAGLGLALAALTAIPAGSSAFWGATVVGIAYNDVLNVRRWPSPTSRVTASYHNGDNVSLTGKCRSVSGAWSVNLDNAGSRWQRRAWVNQHWCEVYHQDAGIGWVKGKYLRVE